MTRLRLAILLAAVAVWALAVFVRVELEAMARRAWLRIRWGRVMDCGG